MFSMGGVDEYKNYAYFQLISEKVLIELPKNLFIPQIKGVFYDIDVWIPENYIGFIEYAYGKNWQYPIENYIGGKEHKRNRKRFIRSF